MSRRDAIWPWCARCDALNSWTLQQVPTATMRATLPAVHSAGCPVPAWMGERRNSRKAAT